jgi:hypothetical protein
LKLRHITAGMALLLLAGCQGAAVGAGGAVLSAAAAIAGGPAPVILSEIATAGCAAQAATNLAAQLAQQRGSAAWTQRFATASALAGLACAW